MNLRLQFRIRFISAAQIWTVPRLWLRVQFGLSSTYKFYGCWLTPARTRPSGKKKRGATGGPIGSSGDNENALNTEEVTSRDFSEDTKRPLL